MNQFFSFDRFSLLVSKHWADNKKRYTLSVLAFAGLLITWFAFILVMEEHSDKMSVDMQLSTYFFSLFIAGTFYASQYYSELGSKPKGSNFLLVPASTFEKFLCSLLYTVILFFIVFTVVFYIVNFSMVTITNSIYANDANFKKAPVANIFDVTFFQFDNNYTLNFLLFFFAIQSVFLLGSVYFRKYNFIKTIIAGVVAWFVLAVLTFFIYRELYPRSQYGDDEPGFPSWLTMLISISLMYVVAPFFWTLTYFRLKAKQL